MTKHKKSHKQKTLPAQVSAQPDAKEKPKEQSPHLTLNLFNQNINRPATPEPSVSCWDGIKKTFGCCKN